MAIANISTGDLITEAYLDSIADYINGTVGFIGSTYTPTLTQSATVTKSLSYCGYTKIGRRIFGTCVLVATGSGTSTNNIVLGLPAAIAAANGNAIIGDGWLGDTSSGLFYPFKMLYNTSTTCLLYMHSGTTFTPLGSTGFTAALANTDVISFTFNYEATS